MTSEEVRHLRASLLRIVRSFNQPRHDREICQELEAHIALQIKDNLRFGMTPSAARRDALLKLGGFQQTVEKCRDVYSAAWVRRLGIES